MSEWLFFHPLVEGQGRAATRPPKGVIPHRRGMERRRPFTRTRKWIPSNPHSSIGFDLPRRSGTTPERRTKTKFAVGPEKRTPPAVGTGLRACPYEMTTTEGCPYETRNHLPYARHVNFDADRRANRLFQQLQTGVPGKMKGPAHPNPRFTRRGFFISSPRKRREFSLPDRPEPPPPPRGWGRKTPNHLSARVREAVRLDRHIIRQAGFAPSREPRPFASRADWWENNPKSHTTPREGRERRPGCGGNPHRGIVHRGSAGASARPVSVHPP